MSESSDRPTPRPHATVDERYRALTVPTPDVVFVVDSNMHVVLANSTASEFMGRSLEELKGAHVTELFGPVGAQFEDRLSTAVATGRLLEFEDALDTDEDEVWLKTSLVPLASIAPGFVMGVTRNITDSKRLEIALQAGAEEIEFLATHDSLTGVANRRGFIMALSRAIALARRGRHSTAFYIDIDLFKEVNDRRGHEFGDETLASVATLLVTEVRDVDVVARVGGDEFAVLLVDSTEDGALGVAERMRANVEELGHEIGVHIGLSIGIADVDPAGSVDSIMATADRRMYENKTAQRIAREAGEGA